jgi:quaternary ammonium compound-resistance protein SugE
MAWIHLLIAGLLEIGWPLGLKISQSPDRRAAGLTLAIICMAGSGFFLWLAQKEIPIGTAYGVWTGIGAVGTFILGIVVYGDPATFWRLISAFLIVAGLVGMKLTHS